MVSEKKRKSNDKYDAKTYKRLMIRFRVGDDDDILKDLKEAQENGITNRERIRQMYEAYKAQQDKQE